MDAYLCTRMHYKRVFAHDKCTINPYVCIRMHQNTYLTRECTINTHLCAPGSTVMRNVDVHDAQLLRHTDNEFGADKHELKLKVVAFLKKKTVLKRMLHLIQSCIMFRHSFFRISVRSPRTP